MFADAGGIRADPAPRTVPPPRARPVKMDEPAGASGATGSAVRISAPMAMGYQDAPSLEQDYVRWFAEADADGDGRHVTSARAWAMPPLQSCQPLIAGQP